ncbi:MAG: YfhO family protein [Vicinamibacterales bacterium]
MTRWIRRRVEAARSLITNVGARHPLVSAALLLVVTIAAAYANVICANKSLVYSDNYNPLDYRLLAENYGPGFVPAAAWQSRGLTAIPNVRDPGATMWQWEPAAEFLHDAIADGEAPYWDPYVGAGAPLMANLTPAFFFPPSLSVVLMGNGSALRNALHLGLIFAAGFFTFLWLRRHEISWPSAAAGGFAFMLGGGVVQTAGSFIGQAVVGIPFVLWLTSRFVDSPTTTRGLVMALGYAAVALASFPPVLLQAFGFASLYAITMIVWPGGRPRFSWRDACVLLGRYAAFAGLSAALVGFYYLPAIELARATPHVAAFYEREGLGTLELRNLAQLWWPALAGGPGVYDIKSLAMPEGYLPYAGAAALCLTLFSDRRGQGDRGPLWAFSLGTSTIVVLKLLGVPPVQWIAHLPVFNSIHFMHYFGIGLGFLAAVLAAIGCENLWHHRLSISRVIVSTGLAAGVLGWFLWEGNAEGLFRWWPPSRWLFEWVLSAGVALLTLLLAAASLWRRGGGATPRSHWLAVVLLGLVAGEGVRNAAFPRQVRNDVFNRPPAYLRALQARGPLVRVMTLGNAPNANTNSPFAVSQLDSLHTFNSPRVFELYRRYAAPRAYLFLREATQLPPEPVLDAAGIGLIAVRLAFEQLLDEVRARSYTPIFADDYIQIFERPAPSRCFFTSDFRVLPANGVLDALAFPRPTRRILLEAAPPIVVPALNRHDDPLPQRMTLWRNSLDVSLHAPRPGLVYCADALMPGWHATVNGEPRSLLFANYGFRAIEVPAGDLEIRMAYRPPGFVAGLVVSSTALAIVFALFVSQRKRRAAIAAAGQ